MSNVENVPPQTMRVVVRELRDLVGSPPAGIKLSPPEADLTDIHASIDGPVDTPYEGGVFRVRVVLGREFPASPPRAYFLTKIFHPNVSASGEICVDTLKKDWKPDLGIKHILLTIKCLLIVPNPESALNAEAGALLLERYDDYFRRARLLTDIHAKGKSECGEADGPSAKRERRPAAGGGDVGERAARAGGGDAGERASRAGGGGDAGERLASRAARDRRRVLKRL